MTYAVLGEILSVKFNTFEIGHERGVCVWGGGGGGFGVYNPFFLFYRKIFNKKSFFEKKKIGKN